MDNFGYVSINKIFEGHWSEMAGAIFCASNEESRELAVALEYTQ
jgi:hypothetical protein